MKVNIYQNIRYKGKSTFAAVLNHKEGPYG
jgi:hypothetical protein